MPLFHLLLVAVIQGMTEFLPVSSSGHLALLPGLTGLEDQGQAIDVAVHVGTLAAVILYFRADVLLALRGVAPLVVGRLDGPGANLALCLATATVPVVFVGATIALTGFDDWMRSVAVIGWATLTFGLVLYWTDRTGSVHRSAEEWSVRHSLIMGLWQVVALIPGTSRSGITISAARFLGYGRQDAARLAMLMSIPAILVSGVYKGTEVAVVGDLGILRDCAIAALFSFLAALAALRLMMRLLLRISFTPYVVYRVCLGLILLWIAYFTPSGSLLSS